MYIAPLGLLLLLHLASYRQLVPYCRSWNLRSEFLSCSPFSPDVVLILVRSISVLLLQRTRCKQSRMGIIQACLDLLFRFDRIRFSHRRYSRRSPCRPPTPPKL